MSRKIAHLETSLGNFKYYYPEIPEVQEYIREMMYSSITLSLFLKKWIPSTCTYVDVGTRDGDSLFPLFPLLNDDSQIICFEPNPEEFQYIKPNILENKPNINFRTLNFALSNQSGTIKFLLDKKGRNGGIANKVIKVGQWDSEEYWQCSSIEDLNPILAREIAEADLIKCDTEGSDMDILFDIFAYKEKHHLVKPPFLLVENWPKTSNKIKSFCNKYQYLIIEPMTNQLISHLNETHATQNIFLIPKDKFTYDI